MNGQPDGRVRLSPEHPKVDPQAAVTMLRRDFGGPDVVIFFGPRTGDFTALVSIGVARLVLADPDPSQLAGSLRLLQNSAGGGAGPAIPAAPVGADGKWQPVPDSCGCSAGASRPNAGDGPSRKPWAVPGP